MRTFDTWTEFFANFKFDNSLPVHITIEHEYKIDYDEDHLYVGWRLRDNRSSSGRLIPISSMSRLPRLAEVHPEHRVEFALMTVREWIRELFLHEIDEGILYKGERVFDPHTPGNKPMLEMIAE